MPPVEISRARRLANRLRDSLPPSLDVAALGVKSKAPFQLLCAREALIWRTEELARNACDALERDDFAAAAVLTRAITENAGLAWKLLELLEARKNHTPQELNDNLMRALVGWKTEPGELPEAFNVITLVTRMDKAVPGVLDSYNTLSEIAHPNWGGALALYGKTDRKNFVTYFGRAQVDAERKRRMIANALLGSLGMFEHAYNRIADVIRTFLAELESLWATTSAMDSSNTKAGDEPK